MLASWLDALTRLRPFCCWGAKRLYNGRPSSRGGGDVPAYGDSLWVCERCGTRCW